MHSADQNLADKDLESLDWNELLNLKRSFSSHLMEASNDIIEVEKSRIQPLNSKIQSNMDSLRSLVKKSREVRNSLKSKNSEFLAVSQKISQSKDFLSTMESRLTNENEENLVRALNSLTESLEDTQHRTQNERNAITQEIKDKSMKLEAIKAVKMIKQGLDQLNNQADAFKDSIRILNLENEDLNNKINFGRSTIDMLYNERRKFLAARQDLLNTYDAAFKKLELINLQMDKIARVRRQRVHLPGRNINDSAILKIKEAAKRKLDSGSKLSFEELKLLYSEEV